ncbi:C-type lectin lectoxin-Thr1-like isoform X1 [Paroedura picta]|uniref:C-type lectin lectoxin-Thr1-like isoform X1 n=1 Tax=Paroedura picta TaxID=143630 RepID=UPI004056BFC3
MVPFSLTFHGFLVVCLFLKGIVFSELHAEAKSCQKDWTFYKGHCYGLFNKKLMWSDAEYECQKLGGHLASIHFPEEMSHLSQYIRKFIKGYENIWIGMMSPHNDQQWQWVDHTPITYEPWDDGEPNNFLFLENCVELLYKKDYTRLNDNNCRRKQPYVCEQRAT